MTYSVEPPTKTKKGDILIVDDTPQNLSFLSTVLTEQGYKVRSALSGRKGLTVARAAQPDLILLDIKMPEMDGYQVCQALKSDEQTQEIPVIFLSALDEVTDKVKAFQVGGIDYIPKPFQIEELLARVENQLTLQAAQAEIRQLNAELEQRVRQRTAQLEREIAERLRIQKKLLHVALHDDLTNLLNRASLAQRLSQVLAHAQQHPDYGFMLMLLDCDNFKLINDSLGHQAGDNLLVAVARRLETCLAPGAVLARLGGDEFAILFEHLQDLDAAVEISKTLQQDIRAPFQLDGHQIHINVSLGIVRGTNAYELPEHLLRDADTAMYQAKAKGKGCYQIFATDMHRQALSFFKIQNELRLALARQELSLFYQPIVSLAAEKITGLEVLARWFHPDRGSIAPIEFIPVAEETGLIIDLDRYILRHACYQLRDWQEQNWLTSDFKLCVNLSAQQLSQPTLIEYLDSVLRETQVDSQNLEIEITENALMEGGEGAMLLLSQLKQRHIQVSIDDFGTGYSSLSYLHRLSVENLKIDRSFIHQIDRASEDLEIVRAITVLAHNLKMTVTAEGIETDQQLRQLKKLGCEFGQGYFFCHPLDNAAVAAKIITEV